MIASKKYYLQPTIKCFMLHIKYNTTEELMLSKVTSSTMRGENLTFPF